MHDEEGSILRFVPPPSEESESAIQGMFPFSQHQRRVIFSEMVKAEIEAGLLRGSKRRQLMHYAAKLGIPKFESCLLIAEVQHRMNQLEPPHVLTPDEIRHTLDDSRRSHVAVKNLLVAGLAAVVVDLAIIEWLF